MTRAIHLLNSIFYLFNKLFELGIVLEKVNKGKIRQCLLNVNLVYTILTESVNNILF